MERLHWIFKRRSIRRFVDRPVEKEKVELLLKAAMAAPSASNRQPWRFVVITRRELLNKLADIHRYAKMLYEAPLALIRPDQIVAWRGKTDAAARSVLLRVTGR